MAVVPQQVLDYISRQDEEDLLKQNQMFLEGQGMLSDLNQNMTDIDLPESISQAAEGAGMFAKALAPNEAISEFREGNVVEGSLELADYIKEMTGYAAAGDAFGVGLDVPQGRLEDRTSFIENIINKDFIPAALQLVDITPFGRIRKGLANIGDGKLSINEEKVVDEVAENINNLEINPSLNPPKNTKLAYKLFRTDSEGNLYPLFVDANTVVPRNEWLQAQAGELTSGGKVKSKIKDLAYRPGWHAGDTPNASHIGGKALASGKRKNQSPDYRKPNQVWALVEMGDDVDWQSVANSRAPIVKSGLNKGKPMARQAHITDQVPMRGHYRYKTNPNMQGEWLIGGEMRVLGTIDSQQVQNIHKKLGSPEEARDLPELTTVIDQKNLSFEDLSGEAQKDLEKYYPEKFKQMTGRDSKKPIQMPQVFDEGSSLLEEDLYKRLGMDDF